MQRERIALEAERDQQRLHLAQLETQRGSAADAGDRLPAAKQALADLEARVAQLQEHEARLTIKSPADGIVIPPPATPKVNSAAEKLTTWHGTPLDAENVGSYLVAGTLLCLVGDPRELEAVAILSQSEIEFVHTGQSVRLAFDQSPQEIVTGEVREVAKIELATRPGQLVAAGRLPARLDPHGRPLPLETSYQVSIALHPHSAALLPGAAGRCKIVAQPQSFGQRLARYFSRTFRFDAP